MTSNLLLILVGSGTSSAQWPHDPATNLPIAIGEPDHQYLHASAPDGNGGMWMVWEEEIWPDVDDHYLYLQRVDADGGLLYGQEGLELTPDPRLDLDDVTILPAEDGGAWIAWTDYFRGLAFPGQDVHAQRVDADGNPMWGSEGIVVSAGPQIAIAVGNGGVISRSLDAGDTWESIVGPTSTSLLGVTIQSAAVIWAVGGGGTMIRSQDLGASWTDFTTTGFPNARAIDGSGFDQMIVVGNGGEWAQSNGLGFFTLGNPLGGPDLLGVSRPTLDPVWYAVGREGRIVKYDTVDWIAQDSGTTEQLHDVSFSSVDVGTAVGINGTILRTIDGGANWIAQDSGITEHLLSVDFFDENFGIAVGYTGRALYTHDGGATWNLGATPVSTLYLGVDIMDVSTAIAVGQVGIVIKTQDGGATWTLQRTQQPGTPDFWEVSAPGNITSQNRPQLVHDGFGGVIVLWMDDRDGDYRVYAQRLDPGGQKMWPQDLAVSDDGQRAGSVFGVPRGGGGATAFWTVSSTNGLYVQTFDADGTFVYTNGAPELTNNYTGSYGSGVSVAEDETGGAFVVWPGAVSIFSYFFAHHVSEFGTIDWSSSVPFSGADVSSVPPPAIVNDGSGGAIFAYERLLDGEDIFVQRLGPDGEVLWEEGGIAVTTEPNDQQFPALASDGVGGVIVGWRDQETGDFLATVLDPNGVRRWGAGAVTVHSLEETNTYSLLHMAPDGEGGALMAWNEGRVPSSAYKDVYAQNVDRHGYLGRPRADITSVVDVPDDQGGWVTVHWDASYLDEFPQQIITSYSLWRRYDMAKRSTAAFDDLEALRAQAVASGLDEALLREMADTGWALVDTYQALYFSSYQAIAPTYGDATASVTPLTEYQVVAHSTDPFVFWTSKEAGGYSVDNLAPDAPLGLQAVTVDTSIELTWMDGLHNVEDTVFYRIYRGETSGFSVGPQSLIGTSSSRDLTDDPTSNVSHFYRVTAVDLHDNESNPSNEASAEIVTAVDATDDMTRLLLRPPYPNPSVGSSLFRFALPAPAPVAIDVFNLAGRRVFAEDLGTLSTGWHEHTFAGRDRSGRRLASGSYFLRLRAGREQNVVKVVLAK